MPTTLIVVDSLPPLPGQGESLLADCVPQHYEIITTYLKHPGILPVPIAAGDDDSGDDVMLCKVHRAWWEKLVTYTIKVVGATPIAPSWETKDNNLVLLDADFKIANPVPADGKFCANGAAGFYRFAMRKGPDMAKGVKAAATIYFQNAKATYKAANFRQDVMDW